MWWKTLFRRRQAEQDLEDEIRSHLAIDAQQRMERGESPAEAERNARRDFGNTALVKDVTRDTWGRRWMDELLQDLRHAVRALRKQWKIAAVAIVSLSIAMTLGILSLSVTNTLLLLPPPGTDTGRLVVVYSRASGKDGQISYPDYEYYRQTNRGFSDIAADYNSVGISTDFSGTTIMSRPVSDNYFSVLAVRPYLGRFFSPGDDKTKDIAVLTYMCWKRLGADPNIIGKKVVGNTVIGVTPPEFTGAFFGLNGDEFRPLSSAEQDDAWLSKRDARPLFLIGRLKPGVTRRQAQAELTTLSAQLALSYPKEDKDRTAVMTRATLLPPDQIDDAELIVSILMTLVILVLLIACANIANLLLALAVGRRQEAAIKLALGAQRWRLIREFLVESAGICAASALIGYAIAAFFARHSNIDLEMPMLGSYTLGFSLHLDSTVAGLSLALLFIAIAATGIAPALYASSPAVSQVLSGEIVVGGTKKNLRRNVLVVIQVAVCTLVLFGLGLCERSLYNLRHTDLGFTARNLVAMSVYEPMQKNFSKEQGQELFDRIRTAVSSLPGVQSVSLTSDVPVFDTYQGNEVSVRATELAGKVSATRAAVDSEYFETLGVHLLSGRLFDSGDRENTLPVAVIDKAMADRLWPGQDPVGKTFFTGEPAITLTVVGVTPTGKYDSLDESARPAFYVPLSQHYQGTINIVARTAGDPSLWVEPLSKTIRALGAGRGFHPMTLTEWMNFGLFEQRAMAVCMTILGVSGLLLAMLGLCAAISYSVSERKKELGIRVALGAARGQLVGMILLQTSRVVGVGIGMGILCGVPTTIMARSFFYGISAVEWTVLIPLSAGMMALSLMIAYVSARPWLNADPMEVVRQA
jgi:predicted permease